ncbi:MAG: RNA polymerase sigma factor [Thermoanaerobaculia bacterium]
MTYDEPTMIHRMLRGDEEAFEAFVDEYYPRLYRFAFPRVDRDDATAQDVVQATFEKAIAGLASYRGEAALFSWICSICRFEIGAIYRRRSRAVPEVRFAEDNPDVQAVDSLAAAEPDPEQALQRKELARVVRVTLDALPLRYAHALEWKYLRNLSVNEIAQNLGLTPKATESLLTRARRAFRDGFAAPASRKGLTT